MTCYFPDSKALFLHVPRTGGTWVKGIAKQCGFRRVIWSTTARPAWAPRVHSTLAHLHPEWVQNVDFVFSFVRHPVSLYEAHWRYLCHDKVRNSMRRRWSGLKAAKNQWSPDFNEWAMRMITYVPCYATRLFEWYVGPEGAEYCNYIGRNETLREDFLEVMTLLGYDTAGQEDVVMNAPKVRYSQRKPAIERLKDWVEPEVTWDASVKEQVMRMETVAINRFYGPGNVKRIRPGT